MIRSKTLVRSTSNDLHCKRHLYMMQAAIGLFPAKPRCWEIHRMSNSWFSCCFSFRDFWGFSSTSEGSLWFIGGICRSWFIYQVINKWEKSRRYIQVAHTVSFFHLFPFPLEFTISLEELYLPNLSLYPLQYDHFQQLSVINQRTGQSLNYLGYQILTNLPY